VDDFLRLLLREPAVDLDLLVPFELFVGD